MNVVIDRERAAEAMQATDWLLKVLGELSSVLAANPRLPYSVGRALARVQYRADRLDSNRLNTGDILAAHDTEDTTVTVARLESVGFTRDESGEFAPLTLRRKGRRDGCECELIVRCREPLSWVCREGGDDGPWIDLPAPRTWAEVRGLCHAVGVSLVEEGGAA